MSWATSGSAGWRSRASPRSAIALGSPSPGSWRSAACWRSRCGPTSSAPGTRTAPMRRWARPAYGLYVVFWLLVVVGTAIGTFAVARPGDQKDPATGHRNRPPGVDAFALGPAAMQAQGAAFQPQSQSTAEQQAACRWQRRHSAPPIGSHIRRSTLRCPWRQPVARSTTGYAAVVQPAGASNVAARSRARHQAGIPVLSPPCLRGSIPRPV